MKQKYESYEDFMGPVGCGKGHWIDAEWKPFLELLFETQKALFLIANELKVANNIKTREVVTSVDKKFNENLDTPKS